MVKFIKEVKFPGGASKYHYEINGTEFTFDFKVKIQEAVFPGDKVVYGIRMEKG